MFFRNLTLFRFPASVDSALNDLEARLAEARLKPVGPQEFASAGFVPPLGRDAPMLSHAVGDCQWVTVGGEQRLLPPSVVNEAVAEKVDEIERVEGRKPGSRTRQRIRDDVVHSLLPRAFVRPVRTDAYFDREHRVLYVDSASRKQAEAVVSELRQALGSFPALPLNAETSPRSVLTGWIAGEPMPSGFELGDECELKDPVEHGAVVKCQRQELTADEVGKHLEAGKQVSRLALVLDERVGFVLGEDLVLRKLKFLDAAVESLESTERDSLEAELDARFALMSGELKRVFPLLASAFRLSAAG
ncbi:MAG TPA: recombination-associated protein RdgC [Xanthomonadales bacterium]|nr:recombination-associated protein RdgC [Xanthomonadales bacterium]